MGVHLVLVVVGVLGCSALVFLGVGVFVCSLVLFAVGSFGCSLVFIGVG